MGSAAAKRKGTRNEHKTIRVLEELGYKCMRAGGSLGAWDVIAIGPKHVRLVQVKTNRWPGKAEMELLTQFPVPYSCSKEVWRWNDYQRSPLLKVFDDNVDEWTVQTPDLDELDAIDVAVAPPRVTRDIQVTWPPINEITAFRSPEET